MTTTKNNSHYFQNISHIHRTLAPIMLLPLLLTTITGTVYQIVDLAGKEDAFKWLLHWHKGQFGALNLEVIYPFLNAIGLFILLFTGISMWFHMLPTSKKESTEAQINIPLAKVPK
ncbi:MAG: PepSY domain-containing protein [Microcoleus sp.]